MVETEGLGQPMLSQAKGHHLGMDTLFWTRESRRTQKSTQESTWFASWTPSNSKLT